MHLNTSKTKKHIGNTFMSTLALRLELKAVPFGVNILLILGLLTNIKYGIITHFILSSL